MAGIDYKSCSVCGSKTFYDAGYTYDTYPFSDVDTDLRTRWDEEAHASLCESCFLTHIVSIAHRTQELNDLPKDVTLKIAKRRARRRKTERSPRYASCFNCGDSVFVQEDALRTYPYHGDELAEEPKHAYKERWHHEGHAALCKRCFTRYETTVVTRDESLPVVL